MSFVKRSFVGAIQKTYDLMTGKDDKQRPSYPAPRETDRLLPVHCFQSRDVIGRVLCWYNEAWLHIALGYLRPVDHYRGRPEELREVRRHKLSDARHRRRERSLNLKQPTLALAEITP